MTRKRGATIPQECRPSELRAAAKRWDDLAEAQKRMAREAEEAGDLGQASVCTNKALLYGNTARALRMEAADGRPRCSCCLSTEHVHRPAEVKPERGGAS